MCQTLLGNASAAMKVTCVAFANFLVVLTPTVWNSSYSVMPLIVELGRDTPGSSHEPVPASADSGGHQAGLLGAELMHR